MNREIKFKAFYKPLKLMIQPESVESINFETKVVGVYFEHEGRGYHKLRMSDFGLLQYTGMDAEEEELHQGDILSMVDENNDTFIAYIDIEGPLTLLVSDHFDDGYELAYDYMESLDGQYWIPGAKKIGNIHDHPHLLGVSGND